jgi:transglutaminase/protease-like cytokinesis protein 3
MSNNSKSFYDISYTVKIGPSIYHVSGRRMKNLKYNNAYFLAEDATIRSKSTKISAKSSTRIQRPKSQRQSVSPEYRSKTSHNCRATTDTDRTTKQQQPQKSNQIHRPRRYTQSNSKKNKQTNDKMIKHEGEVLTDLIRQKTSKEKSVPVKSIQNERQGSVNATINNQNQEIIRFFNEQKRSLIHLLEQHIRAMTTPSIDVIKQIVIETLKSQQQILTTEFEHILIQKIQQELQKNLPNNDTDKPQSNSLDVNTISQLQNIVTQTIETYIASTNTYNNNTLNHLFSEQKQFLIDTLTQQQSTSCIDLIKQALIDALTEYNSTSIATNTTTIITNSRQPNIEIEINADLKQTRIDVAFRQQRDTIVANRYLRDNVRQWSNVRSILSLIKKIQECGTNDFENAWLLFCWIGQNIRYDLNCQNNSIEYVFQNRTGLSYGFVNLYYECCSLLNIQCLQISGYIKQNENLKLLSHIWNAIIIDQYTYLIDPTWGAGAGDNKNEFQDFYFLISPEEFIYTHYSKDNQLLQPKLTKHQFLSLPIMKSNYYRLNLNLLKPKQGLNQINENIFQISIKTPAYVDLIVSLQINNVKYPSHLHTLCQRDIVQTDIMNCFFAPPINGLYEIIIYAKTNDEIKYQETISMQLNVSNMYQAITFPIRSQSFIEYKCILIEPFRCLIQENEHIFIIMKIPDAYMITIINGNELIIPNNDEYQNSLLKKEVDVKGDIHICVQWNEKTEKISTICIFNMI